MSLSESDKGQVPDPAGTEGLRAPLTPTLLSAKLTGSSDLRDDELKPLPRVGPAPLPRPGLGCCHSVGLSPD